MAKVLLAVCLGFSAALVHAAPAVRLEISDCAPAPPPVMGCPAVINVYQLGQPVAFWVLAVDVNGLRATGYTGTVVFTSSDGSALLPSPHVFTPADNSVFLATITFNSPGKLPGAVTGTHSHTVTATDTANQLSSTPVNFSLLDPAAPSVPALSNSSLLGLILILGLTGILVLRHRRRAVAAANPDREERRKVSQYFMTADIVGSGPYSLRRMREGLWGPTSR